MKAADHYHSGSAILRHKGQLRYWWLSAILACLTATTAAQTIPTTSQRSRLVSLSPPISASSSSSPNPKFLEFLNISTSGSQQDPCSSVGNPCVFGICRVNFSFGADQPYCECPPDRTGRQCESIVGRRQCLHNTCFNGGICYVEPSPKIFSCFCPSGYSGVLCEVRLSCEPPCPDDSICADQNGTFMCRCRDGYNGIPGNCSGDNLVCKNVRCPPGTICVSVASIYTCKPAEFFIESGHVTIVLPTLNPFEIGSPPPFQLNNPQSRKSLLLCSSQSCFNGGNCSQDESDPRGIKCDCPNEWTGSRCESDMDECELFQPCHNNGTCQNRAGGYECLCKPGLTGKHCDTNIDDCFGVHCLNGGVCVDEINGYRCQCSDRYMGRLCEKPFNPCSPRTCMHNGICRVSLQRNFTCVCQVGYTGPRCETDIDDCVNVKCPHGQTCIDGLNSHTCTCPPGKGGPNCDQPDKYCNFGASVNITSSLCLNNGTCLDQPNSSQGYQCKCPDHYMGHRCEIYVGNYCETFRPCKFGICSNKPQSSYECSCSPGYSGINCTENIDDCVANPCMNEGVCVDDVNGYKCLCSHGYTGITCETVLADCASNPCWNNGSCTEQGGIAKCSCIVGTTGPKCELIVAHHSLFTESLPNVCQFSSVRCQHNGSCVADDRFAEGFKCICSNGYTGNHCETFVFNDSGIPDCPTSFCKNGGVCYFPSSNTPACNCTIGFSGPFCQFQELTSALKGSPNVCQPSPCGKGSKCVDRGNGTFVCICSDGLTGEKCDQDIDECTNNPKICGGTQTCINTFGKYECVCEANFTGPNCSIRLTGCSDTVCPRNRYCQPFWNETIQQHTHQCLCNYGYQGESCELETTASFTGQSLLAFISSSQGTAYRLQLRFRTTLPHAYIASGDDILGTNVYRLELTDHQIRLTWGLSNPEPKVLTLGRNLSDSNWYGAEIVYSSMKIKLKLSNTEGRPIAMDQSDVQLESLAVFSTKFGGIASRRQSTTEDSANFVGCLQDVRVNDQWIIPSRQTHSSVNVLPGCNRSQQCRNDTCRTNGQCVDLWITHKCICERPFLPPNCDYSLKEATFGHEKSRNYVKIDMTSSEKQSVEMNVEISMLLRTTASQGQLMYIGSPASLNSDLETFIAVELTGGRIRSNVKLGQKVQLFTGGPIISNGNFHLFSIVRNENRFKAYLNKSLIIDQLIDHPFPHPLLAEIFYVGGIPDIPLPGNFSPKKSRFSRQSTNDQQTISPSAFSSSSSFKGLIQDLRLRDQLIPFFPLPDTVRSLVAPVNTFGRTSLVGGVLQGTVSDDTCTSGPCANDGICNITFNDFKCTCRAGWRGKTCGDKDFCFLYGCPDKVTCQNENNNYYCLTPATFDKGSSAMFDAAAFPKSEKQKITSLRFAIRTRDIDGLIFYMGSSRAFLSVELQNGSLLLRYQLGSNDISESLADVPLNLTNAEWHFISITLAPDKSSVTVDGTSLSGMMSVPLTTSLADLLSADGPIAFGSIPDEIRNTFPRRFVAQRSFKGCLKDFQFVDLTDPNFTFLPIQFLEPEQLKHQKTLGGSTFIPTIFNKIRTGCYSDPFCLLDSKLKTKVQMPSVTEVTCFNNATCKDLWNAFQCECIQGFTGERCEIILTSLLRTAMNSVSPHNFWFTISTRSVTQHPQYQTDSILSVWSDFQTNIDDCQGHNCASGSTCVDGIATYTCACPPGFTGTRCETDINECDNSPCKNGATCHDMIAVAQCTCAANYTGQFCELLITVDCASNPCMHGSTCRDLYKGTQKTFECACGPGYTGKQCETEIDYCAIRPCQLPAKCVNQPRLQQYICQCDSGFTGKNCDVNIDECVSHRCQHGKCVDGIANYTCVCESGWEGQFCERDIDECLSRPCIGHSMCINSPGNYSCQCQQFYMGVHCEVEGICLKTPCVHGECQQSQTSPQEYSCKCPLGYSGVNCSTEIDYCLSSPCLNNATCQRSIGAYHCVCLPGYSGTNCEVDINECLSNPCRRGRCLDLVNAYRCDCSGTGYRGIECAEDIDECADNKSICSHGTCLNLQGSFNCSCGQDWVGQICDRRNPCQNNSTNKCLNNGQCHSGRVTETGEVAHDCTCEAPFEGRFCEHRKESLLAGTPIAYIIGPIIGALCLIAILAIIAFLMVARQKRATRGTYSPSRQEINGARLQLGPMMKPPPEERLI